MDQHRQPNGEPQGITGRGAFARFVTACRLMGTKSVPGTVTVVVGRLVLGDTGIPGTAVTKVTARAAAVANSTVAAAIPRRRSAAPAPSPARL
jgi:hypothetical protein